MNKVNKTIYIAFVLLLFNFSSAFAANEFAITIQKVADPLTENMLLEINSGNYQKFSQNFDSELKKQLTAAVFQNIILNNKKIIGRY